MPMRENTPSPADTRERVVEAARELIVTRSYLGFSFQDIAERVGIRKPSLYHHFATKEALAVEVVRQASEAFERWTSRMSQSPAKQLDAYFRMYRDTLRAGSAVCPAGAFAPGWDMVSSEVQVAVQALRNTQVAWLATVLSELGPPRRARARAAYVFAACQGALIAARMTGDVADFDEAISVARRALED